MVAALIAACEIAFWLFVLSGLAARYLLGRRRIGAVLLAATPVVDALLLAAIVIDLRGGGEASSLHALGAVYLAISLVYGPRMVRWADARFAHRFAGGPSPPRPPCHGRAHAAHERAGWYRHALAWALGTAILLACVAIVGDPDRTEALARLPLGWGVILAIDFVISFSYTLWPRRASREGDAPFGAMTASSSVRGSAPPR
jgi:hypothetical protein